jgi:hypothetical protein
LATHGVTSNTAYRSSGAGTAPIALWNPATYGPNCEAYIDVPTKPGNNSSVGVVGRWDTTGHNGYGVFVIALAGTDEVRIYRSDAGVSTQIGSSVVREFTSGESIGIEIVGNTITAYIKSGGTWSAIGSATDSTYTAAGYIGLSVPSSAARADNFGGGTAAIKTLAALGVG